MSAKWNENKIAAFLVAYEKYPCLWNPYNKYYYNCSAKNAAFYKVLQSLNISGLTAADCMKEIKNIREKYGHEQLQIMASLHSRNPYKSPYSWYNIMTKMLAKVIEDEKKCNSNVKLNTVEPLFTVEDNSVFQNLRPTALRLNNTFVKKNTATTNSKSKSQDRSNDVKNNSSNKEVKKPSTSFRNKTSKLQNQDDESIKNLKTTKLHLQDTTKAKRKELSSNIKKKSLKFTKNGQLFNAQKNQMPNNECTNGPLKCPPCGWEKVERNDTKTSYVMSPVSCHLNTNLFQRKSLENTSEENCDLPEKSQSSYFGNSPKIVEEENCMSNSVAHRAKKHRLPNSNFIRTDEKFKERAATDCCDCGKFSKLLETVPEVASRLENGIFEAYSQFKVFLPVLSKDKDCPITKCTQTELRRVCSRCTETFAKCVTNDNFYDNESRADVGKNFSQPVEAAPNAVKKHDKEVDSTSSVNRLASCGNMKTVGVNTLTKSNKDVQCSNSLLRLNCSTIACQCNILSQRAKKVSKCNVTDDENFSNTICVNTVLTPGGRYINSKSNLIKCCSTADISIDKATESEELYAQDNCQDNTAPIEEGNLIIMRILLYCLDKMLTLENKSAISALKTYLSEKIKEKIDDNCNCATEESYIFDVGDAASQIEKCMEKTTNIDTVTDTKSQLAKEFCSECECRKPLSSSSEHSFNSTQTEITYHNCNNQF